jgi:hypothetical protein
VGQAGEKSADHDVANGDEANDFHAFIPPKIAGGSRLESRPLFSLLSGA